MSWPRVGAALVAAAVALAPAGCALRYLKGGTDAPPSVTAIEVTFYTGTCQLTNVLCGGTAIAPSWVLTAAHCFDGNTAGLRAGMGNDGSFCMSTYNVGKTVKYPCYTAGGAEYDIALAQIDPPLPATTIFPPLTASNTLPDNVSLAGRGQTLSGNMGTLKICYVPVQSDATCLAAFPTQFKTFMHCAGTDTEGFGKGDSGGPVLVAVSNSNPGSLTGVAALGGPGSSGKYSVFTSVAPSTPYPEWIQNTMNNSVLAPLCP